MQAVAFIIVGLVIGIFTGLSVSPVLSVVLTSLIAAAATIAAILGGYLRPGKDNPKDSLPSPKTINVVPLAWLTIFILIGSLIGVYARVTWTANLSAQLKGEALRPPPQMQTIVEEWEALGYKDQSHKDKLFDAYLSAAGKVVEAQAKQDAQSSTLGLFSSVSVEECERLRNAPDTLLRQEMQAGSSDELATIADQVTDTDVLGLVVKAVCGEEQE